jgi:hypothetical protein
MNDVIEANMAFLDKARCHSRKETKGRRRLDPQCPDHQPHGLFIKGWASIDRAGLHCVCLV